MLIVVPMAGRGERFVRAGFLRPKPLIEVDGRPMIEHVVRQFSSDDRFLFVVNREHDASPELRATLLGAAPGADIVAIEPHKDGPVASLLAVEPLLRDAGEVVVTYCDYGTDGSMNEFKAWVHRGQWDAAMTAYRGFHPHSLGPTMYAYLRTDGERVLEVREKGHFTPRRMDEFASSGLYYFRSGRDLVESSRHLVASNQRVAGEFYVSMVVQQIVDRGGRVGVHELPHFFQWGTPEDLRDYDATARALRDLDETRSATDRARSSATLVVPMAGKGQRFRDRGYASPKPFIDVLGAPMAAQAISSLPRPRRVVLVVPTFFTSDPAFVQVQEAAGGSPSVVPLGATTAGQAVTALEGVLRAGVEGPVLVAPCDSGCRIDLAAWAALEADADADLVVWTARHHLPALWHPERYGFVHADESGRVLAAAVKEPVSDVPLERQEIIVGTFFFPEAGVFRREVEAMVRDDHRVNGEFYIDTLVARLVAAGRRVRAFRVDRLFSWGTPDELDTFRYWNQVFRSGQPWRSAAKGAT